MDLSSKINSAAALGDRKLPANDRQLEIKTYNIHDILKGDGSCPVTLNTLQYLIRSQASLHMVQVQEDSPSRLEKMLRSRVSTIRGFVMHAEGAGAVAYAIYYPMIDGDGKRVAYCEDFHIVEAFRGRGVANILFHELAKRTTDDNAHYLQWATDKRNIPVRNFAENRLGADTPPKVVTISANDALHLYDTQINSFSDAWLGATKNEQFVTREIALNDVHYLEKAKVTGDIIRNTGDMPFKGFITFDKADLNKPVAIIPGWIHFSTFQAKEGIHLENPVFIDVEDNNKAEIVTSIFEAVNKKSFGKKKPEASPVTKYSHLRWHINVDNSFMLDLLQEKMKFPLDSMLGTVDSELMVYTLSNGNLKKWAKTEPARIIHIPSSHVIGAKSKPHEESISLHA